MSFLISFGLNVYPCYPFSTPPFWSFRVIRPITTHCFSKASHAMSPTPPLTTPGGKEMQGDGGLERIGGVTLGLELLLCRGPHLPGLLGIAQGPGRLQGLQLRLRRGRRQPRFRHPKGLLPARCRLFCGPLPLLCSLTQLPSLRPGRPELLRGGRYRHAELASPSRSEKPRRTRHSPWEQERNQHGTWRSQQAQRRVFCPVR